MSDYIVMATAANHRIRAYAAVTTELTEHARAAHNMSPIATAALGRLMTAGAMMGATLKNNSDILTLQIKCEGPIQGLTVTVDSKLNIKGFVENPGVMLPPSDKGKLDVGGALGLGVMNIIKDLGLKEPYLGQTHLVTSEIAEDLTYYFAQSEQTPTSIGLGVLMNGDNTVAHAGGFFIQLMPDTDEETIVHLENKLKEISSVTQMMEEGNTPEMILNKILGDLELNILEKVSTRFYCNCKERVEAALISIGRKDIKELLDEKKPVEMHCHFCNTTHVFEIEKLENILAQLS